MNSTKSSPVFSQTPLEWGDKNSLFHPVIDFMTLGGASLIIMLIVVLFPNPDIIQPKIAAIFFIMAQFINHPHFIHSYQIFYRDFSRKTGPQTDPVLRARYWFAGIIAPIIIGLYYGFALWNGDMRLIGYSISAMGFFVGWHYVKQGYGMLSVQSALQRKFFTQGEKTLLIWNAYAGWVYSWVFANRLFIEKDFWGVSHYAINLPDSVHIATLAIMLILGAVTAAMFLCRLLPGAKGLPWTGVMAYLTSIYIWRIVLEFNPLFAFMIPAFHSLQYLTVVWRFQLNVEAENVANGATTRLSRIISQVATARLIRFYILGIIYGIVAFWALPTVIFLFTDPTTYQTGLIWPFAVVWVFINIHHYFLDNVMWRKDNPDVSRHLFAHR